MYSGSYVCSKKRLALVSLLLFLMLACGISIAENAGYRYFYNQLDVNQKQIYDYVLTLPRENAEYTLELCDETIVYGNIESVIYVVSNTIQEDLPEETAWLDSLNLCEYDPENGIIRFEVRCISFYRESDYEKMQRIMEIAVAKADPDWDYYTKACYISRVVNEILDYDNMEIGSYDRDYDYTQSVSQSLLSITGGNTVCTGFSRLYKAMADRIGLPCVSISSRGHAFNYVMMEDGNWYGVEPQSVMPELGGSNTFYPGDMLYEPYDEYFAGGTIEHPKLGTNESYQYDGQLDINSVSVDIPAIDNVRNSNEGQAEFIYEVNSDEVTCTIVGYSGEQKGDLVIPELIDGYTVTVIGDSAFSGCSAFTGKLVLPDTITEIKGSAFAYCSGFTGDIILPENLIKIGRAAFAECINLDGRIFFNSALQEIGASAFAHCERLTGDLQFPMGLAKIGYRAFSMCSELDGYIHIPDSIDSWSTFNIWECNKVKGYVATENHEYFSTINGVLFNADNTVLIHCPNSYSGTLVVPDSVVQIGDYALSNCKNITELILPSNLTKVGEYGAYALKGLTTPIQLPENLMEICKFAFAGSDVQDTIQIHDGMIIEENAFADCYSVNKVVFDENVKQLTIEPYVFAGLTADFYIPASVTEIPDGMSFGCNMVIYCFLDSYAHQYAIDQNIAYFDIKNGYRLNNRKLTLYVNDDVRSSHQLIVYDTFTDTPVDDIVWISDKPDYVSVSDEGCVKALKREEGSGSVATVTARIGDDIELSCTVEIREEPQAIALRIDNGLTEHAVGDVIPFTFAYTPETSNPISEWTIDIENETVIKPYAYNSLLAAGAGETLVCVTTPDGLRAEERIVVKERAKSFSIVSPEKPLYTDMSKVYSGDLGKFSICFEPEESAMGRVKWSTSDIGILSVLDTGEIWMTGNAGTVTVYATDKAGRIASLDVIVEDPITISLPYEPVLYLGYPEGWADTLDVTVNINRPLEENVDLQLFFTNGGVVETDSNNMSISAFGKGTTEIYVYAVLSSDECVQSNHIEVSVRTPFDFTVPSVEINLDDGTKYQLGIFEWSDAVVDRELTWSVLYGESIISVESDGTITAFSPGYACVRAENSQGYFRDCAVTVTQYVYDISCQDKITLQVGDTANIQYSVNNYTNFKADLRFMSSDTSVAVVDEDGCVTAVGPGTAEIIVEDGITGIYDICVISVWSMEGHMHVEIVDPEIKPTCTESGLTEGKRCSACGEILIAQEFAAPLGHDERVNEAVPATCIDDGLTEGRYCVICNEVFSEQTIVPAMGHKPTEGSGVLPTCTTSGWTAESKCEVCEETIEAKEEIPALGHTPEVLEGREATCTVDGLTEGAKCSVCGEILTEQEVILAKGHEIVVDAAVEPTCTESGLTEGQYCSVCNEVLELQTIVPAMGHKPTEGSVVLPTCTTSGWTAESKCEVCEEIIEAKEEIPALGHTPEVLEGKEATCMVDGLTEGAKCSVCGEILTEQEVITAKGHEIVVDAAVEPTCTESGLTEGQYCSVCNEVLELQTIVPAMGHKPTEGSGVLPTCTTSGWTAESKCEVCGETIEAKEEIPALGHTSKVLEGREATCTVDGLTEGAKCSVCGEILREQEVILAKGHEIVVDAAVEPTCTESGLTEGQYCCVCNEVLELQTIVPAMGHKPTEGSGVLPTCTTSGWTAESKCEVCGEIIEAKEEIPALGHTSEVLEGKEATCMVDGLTEGAKCSVCGEILTEQEVIPAKGHEIVVDAAVEPTCTESGLTEGQYCSVCNEVLELQTIVPAKGHKPTEGSGVLPTCTTSGWTAESKCEVCGETIEAKEEIPALGHTSEVLEGKNASCTDEGLTEGRRCIVCGEVLMSQEIISAKGHEIVVDAAVGPTCTEPGLTEGKYCAVCGCVIAAQEMIPATGHTNETVPGKAPTCAEHGLTDGIRCTVCAMTVETQENIAPLGHNEVVIDGIPVTHITAGLTSGLFCDRCGEILIEQTEIPVVDVVIMHLPMSVSRINRYAFSNVAVECVIIPEKCKRIEAYAFANNNSLRFVEIPASVEYIDDTAFANCRPDLVIVTTPGSFAHIYAQKTGRIFVLTEK